MCGIVGYLGKKAPVPLIVDSLRLLEYRGYDSAGVAYLDDDNLFQVYKASGKLLNLEKILPKNVAQSNGKTLRIGIGHIRWATHGAANDINAHPHLSSHKEIALVHNGIIENYIDIREALQKKGVTFTSETDTECVVQLLESIALDEQSERKGDFVRVIQKALAQLKGTYAFTVISRHHPDRIYAVRNHAPLVVGVGDDEFVVASDSVAVANHTSQVVFLKDKEIAEISPDGIRLFSMDGQVIEPVVERINMGPLQIDKKGFKHFMMKEIHEQSDVIRNSLAGRLVSTEEPIRLLSREEDKAAPLDKMLKQVKRIVVVGCGTSYNAALVGKYFIEELVRIPVEVESAGEYRYRRPIIDSDTMIVAISQSGETADTLAAASQAAALGAKILTVTNREDSSLARESDMVLSVRAGVEVSVCATKSFLAQIVVLYLLGIAMAELRKSAPAEEIHQIKSELLRIPTLIEAVLSDLTPIQALAKKYGSARDVLFIARGVNYPVALEGALKLKEISYIHAEGYSGSELKHGPIAMLDDSIPVIAVLVPGVVFDKTLSNCQEAKARDAHLVGITTISAMKEQAKELDSTFEALLPIPDTVELLSPLITTIPLQLLAYYIAEHLGKDVDQPRNLAKSVTVE